MKNALLNNFGITFEIYESTFFDEYKNTHQKIKNNMSEVLVYLYTIHNFIETGSTEISNKQILEYHYSYVMANTGHDREYYKENNKSLFYIRDFNDIFSHNSGIDSKNSSLKKDKKFIRLERLYKDTNLHGQHILDSDGISSIRKICAEYRIDLNDYLNEYQFKVEAKINSQRNREIDFQKIFEKIDLFKKIAAAEIDRSKKEVVNVTRVKRDPYKVALLMGYVIEELNNKCEYCSKELFLKENGLGYFEAHHIIPLSVKGGKDILSNMVALCPECHRKAHHSTLENRVKLENDFKKIAKIRSETWFD